MASKDPIAQLTRRERQIMEVVFARGAATAAEIQRELPDRLSYSSVRTFLRILEEKGYLSHREEGTAGGGTYVYTPTVSPSRAAQSAMRKLLETFFGGSLEKAVATHLTDPRTRLSREQIARLRTLIEEAEKQGE